ncbi:glycosyltransferase family 4 protein [Intestinibacter sp.]
MKILMVNKFLYPKGGAETYFLKIGKYLEEQGHELQYFGMFDKKNTVGNELGLYTSNMDFHGKSLNRLLYPFKIIYSFEAKKKITQIIKDMKPDIIHLNNINFQLTPSIIEAASDSGVPVVQTVHDYQMLCPNHLFFDINTKVPCEKCLDGSKLNCMKNNCIHNSKIKSIIGSIEAILYKNKNTYSKVKHYICPSVFMEEKLNTQEIYKNKTTAIHNFIELSDEVKVTEKEDYVLFFGRLSEEKGLEVFLDACKKLKHIKFIVAGMGPMEDMCKGIDNVEFVGFKTGQELNDLIKKALFSVYPSIWYENCPLSILESESLGTPVMASNFGGIPELVDDNKTGIILKEVTEDELIKQTKKLYNDKSLLKEMSKNCIEKRDDMISLEEYCDRLMKIYNGVLEEGTF